MTSQLNVDTIKGKTTEGSITVQGEGSATTNLQQGSCKSWALTDQTTPEVLDSFNQASMTDVSTGIVTWRMTNVFSSTNWVASSSLHADNTTNAKSMVHSGTRTSNGTPSDKVAGGTSWYAKNSSHSGYDSEVVGHMAFGDLA
tara:strand:+ start:174 stop:602 length:429 start_codon:yes stop_codon:yes gene_type:complete